MSQTRLLCTKCGFPKTYCACDRSAHEPHEAKMTPSQMRVFVAEKCGWKHRLATHDSPVERCGMKLPNCFGHPIEAWWHDTAELWRGVYAIPPNYLESLDAMHEAEKMLTERQRYEMGNLLMNPPIGLGYDWGFATALQRCTAFCRVMGEAL